MSQFEQMNDRLERIENLLEELTMPKKEKHFYSTSEAADKLNLSKWYVRRLCSTGEILAEKHPESGRFLISADEVDRLETRRGILDD